MSNSEPERLLAYVDGKYLRPTRAMLDLAGTGNVEVLVDDQHSTLLVSNAQGCLLRINGIRGHLQFRDLYGSKTWRPRLERDESHVDYVSPAELRKELQRLRNAEADCGRTI
jgi:hypothetical protein